MTYGVRTVFNQSNFAAHFGAFFKYLGVSNQLTLIYRAPAIGLHMVSWNFVSAVAYHLCLNLPAAFLQPRANHKRAPSTWIWKVHQNGLHAVVKIADISKRRCALFFNEIAISWAILSSMIVVPINNWDSRIFLPASLAEAGLELALWLSESVSQQNSNDFQD